ncbi:MAG: general secretion pathway protein GspK [Candidatus Omnitrophica bacterium]|nr:general secretion pathway protein GspK [Candidatus Omnitrophota bacterium]
MGNRSLDSQAGSLLIITLWLVTILSAFAVAVARYLSVELRTTKYRLVRSQAQAIARSGVYAAMQRLAADGTHGDEAYDWLGDSDWAFVQGDGPDPSPTWELRAAGTEIESTGRLVRGARAWVHVADEEGKVFLNGVAANAAAASTLAALLDGADDLAARIVDYVDKDATPNAGGGLEIDESTDPPYVAKNAPVAVTEELLAIPGMERLAPKRFASFRELTSPYYGTAGAMKVNVNTASADVLEAIGLSGATIAAIEQFRDGPDGADAHEQDGRFEQEGAGIITTLVAPLPAGGGWSVADPQQRAAEEALLTAMGVTSQTFTVVSAGEVPLSPGRAGGSLVSARVEAVVRRKGCDKGMPEPCIIAWREW